MSFNFQQDNPVISTSRAFPAIDMQSVMKRVYVWMTLGLAVTALVSWFVASNVAANPEFAAVVYNPITLIISLIASIAIAIIIPLGMTRRWLSPTGAAVAFFVYAIIMGVMLSSILLVYTAESIASALATTAVLFGVMSVFGYTTKMDLMKWGTYLFMGLIGMLVVSLLNAFVFQSTPLMWAMSLFGVVLFTAMTAYDTQKIKNMANSFEAQNDSSLAAKISIYGALELYLDFINLFLMLLRLFGSRD